MLKYLPIVTTLFSMACYSAVAQPQWHIEPNSQYHRGQDHPLCHEMVKLLNDPANAQSYPTESNQYSRFSDFVIPHGYRHVTLPSWELITPEDYRHYLEEIKHRGLTYDNVKTLEKAVLDVDYDGRRETILRAVVKNYSKGSDPKYFNTASKQSIEEYPFFDMFGRSTATSTGFIFLYKDKVYITLLTISQHDSKKIYRRYIRITDIEKPLETYKRIICELEAL